MCAAHLTVPVVTSLHTTYKVVAPFKPKWANLLFKLNHVDKVIQAEHWLLEHSVAILANSMQIVEEINKLYDGVLANRGSSITHIPHGVGVPIRIEPDAHSGSVGTECGKIRILFVGRMEERKGADILLKALSLLPGLLATMQVDIVGAWGDEGDSYSAKVRHLADALRRRCRGVGLTFHGYVQDQELQRYYASCDIFIAPSRFESFGLTLIEAMRHGAPVIASDVGGMREIVTDGVDGYLIGVEDFVQLAERIKRLSEHAELRKEVAKAAKQTYETRFSAARMAARIGETFESLVEANRGE
jgi:glycosyltransferase involved in cell wall biosynthesis